VYTDAKGTPVSYTVGTHETPTGAAFTPSSSNCKTVPTISNGLALAGAQSGGSVGSSPTPTASGGNTSAGSPKTTAGAGSNGASSGGPSPSGSGASAGRRNLPGLFPEMGALIGLTVTSIMAVAAGAVMVL
jgi:hypothetical protein